MEKPSLRRVSSVFLLAVRTRIREVSELVARDLILQARMKSSWRWRSFSSISVVEMAMSTPTMTQDMVVRLMVGWGVLGESLVTEKGVRAPELILRSRSWGSRLSEEEVMIALPGVRVLTAIFLIVLVVAGSNVWVRSMARALLEQKEAGSPLIA